MPNEQRAPVVDSANPFLKIPAFKFFFEVEQQSATENMGL